MKYIDLFEKFVIKQSSVPTKVQGTGSRPITDSGSQRIRKEDIIVATNETIHQIVRDEIKRLGKDADLNHIDVSQVTDMPYLFQSTDFQGDVSRWDVSNVKNIRFMFDGCKNFNGDLSNWNVSNVEDMTYMFEGCNNFNSDLSNWNVSNVKNMGMMFEYCENFNCDLSNWDVSNVEDMNHMFYCCYYQSYRMDHNNLNLLVFY